jgi:hypothetical protein
MVLRANADLFAGLDLISNVHGGRRIVADSHRREPGPHAVRDNHLPDFKLYILLDLVR